MLKITIKNNLPNIFLPRFQSFCIRNRIIDDFRIGGPSFVFSRAGVLYDRIVKNSFVHFVSYDIKTVMSLSYKSYKDYEDHECLYINFLFTYDDAKISIRDGKEFVSSSAALIKKRFPLVRVLWADVVRVDRKDLYMRYCKMSGFTIEEGSTIFLDI